MPGGGKPFAQKILASCPNFYETVRKKRVPYDATTKAYELIKHALKEIAVFAILTAKDINDTIRVIVDYRVDICPFNVNIRNCAIIIRRRGGGGGLKNKSCPAKT